MNRDLAVYAALSVLAFRVVPLVERTRDAVVVGSVAVVFSILAWVEIVREVWALS